MNNLFFNVKDNNIQCTLCPNYCALKEDQFGLCNTRKRNHDIVENPFSGIISSSGIDPIEKKPLYHFKPDSKIFSIGFYGCTLHCQFCQNYSISQLQPELLSKKIRPEEMVEFLIKNNHSSIAFTYSEPTLHFEWILETSKLCRKNNINTVLVTNGYLNKEPAEMLLDYIDAANIDLKSAKEDFYKKICKGKISPVKEFIKIAFQKKVHIEITTLVITDTNDDISECIEISDFLSGLSCDIPFHISRYHPDYNFNKAMTSLDTINKWVNTSQKKLEFVYGGNINDFGDTYCKNCKSILIKRSGYNISIINLNKDGTCNKCSEKNNFII